MKNLFFLVLIILMISCQENNVNFPEQNHIVGLATPVNLNHQKSEIIMSDYFNDIDLIDSVTMPDGLTGDLSHDKKRLGVRIKEEFPLLGSIQVWIESFPYSLLVKKSPKMVYTFRFNPEGIKYNKVQIAGDMNGWNPKATELSYQDNTWQTNLILNPGRYQYKLVLNDTWKTDFSNPDSVESPVSGYNSLLTVGNKDTSLQPYLISYRNEGNHISLKTTDHLAKIFVFWQNYQLPEEDILLADNHITFSIPQNAVKLRRSYIRVWAYNSHGVSNDLLIPLNHGNVVLDTDELTREDWEASVFYFLMIDRFNNGSKENDFPVDDPEILPKANYYGGDLTGVKQKIEDGYFEKLGINTIWLSPVTQNPLEAYGLWPEPRTKFSGYHGYWPVSSSKIDFRFGKEDELQNLINLAHEKDMNVILDYVANHVHEQHPVYQNHPEWATELYLPDSSLNTERWDEHRLTTWFDTFLPTLDLSNPEVVDIMTDSALFWIENFNLDGFRHDATKHIPELFWRELTQKLKRNISIPLEKRIYQVGETYGNRELIGSYVSTGMMDAQFDFNVYDQTVAAFAKDDVSLENLATALQESIDYYGYHNLMGYISGNQDRPRFISLAGGDLDFGEDAKLAGWTREIGVGGNNSYKKLQSLIAFNMTIPGIPTIYYGDEYGMPGANDPDNRRMAKFDNLNEDEIVTRKITTKLASLRRQNLSLIYGDYKLLHVDNNSLAYSRTYFDQIAIVVFNKSSGSETIKLSIPEYFSLEELSGNFESQVSITGNNIEIILQNNSFDVLIN